MSDKISMVLPNNNSVSRLAALADGVRVYCGHKYTAANIAFARAVEPQNTFLQQRAQDVAARRLWKDSF